jgi:arabinogalactan endo-1,4-beta-galactosidase
MRAPVRRATVLVAALAGGALAVAALAVPAQAAPVIANASFESSASALTGWTVTGTTSAASVSSTGAQSGSRRANLWSGGAYTTELRQTVSGLSTGWWTLRVWAKSGSATPGAALDVTRIGLEGCGASWRYQNVPSTEQDDGWVQVAVSAYVSAGSCTITLRTGTTVGGAWAQFDNVTLTQERITRGVRGMDISSLPKNEAKGATYRTAANVVGDPVTLLKGIGVNYARLKVWVNPADGYNTKARVLAVAKRVKAAGMGLLIDFHYSDTWADPGAQKIPAAWSSYNLSQLASAVSAHTTDVLTALKNQGTPADMVQIGNEINPGMLVTGGAASGAVSSWSNLGTLLKAGANATRSVAPNAKIVLHLTNLNNGVAGLQSWYSNAIAQGVPFDVIGLSYYGYWHGSLSSLQKGANTLLAAFPGKQLAVVETAYGFTTAQDDSETNIFASSQVVPGFPATAAGQASHLRAVQNVVAGLPGGRGLGVFYWEGTWTAVAGSGWDPTNPSSGNGWENQAIFDYADRMLQVSWEFQADPGA